MAVAALTATSISNAFAACPQELAVYSERDAQASLEFTPVVEGAATKHTFKVKFPENGVVLDGIVMWTEEVARPYGIVMHDCPEGDVTGAELDACTVWQGVIYAVNEFGAVSLLPGQGAAAAIRLLLPDFGSAVRQSSAYGPQGVSTPPWDVFELSGCQE